MKQVFGQNKIFILLYFLLCITAILTIFSTNKTELHFYFNHLVGKCDLFFKYITYIGDGFFVITLGIILLFFNTQKSLTILVTYASSSITTQVLKHIWSIITHNDRPVIVFGQEGIPLKTVADVSLYVNDSFPSGHATAAFGLFFCLSFFSKNKLVKITCLLAAMLVGFSRVYLSQHFFEDITAGSLIGVLFAWWVCAYFYYSKKTDKFTRLNQPVWKLF